MSRLERRRRGGARDSLRQGVVVLCITTATGIPDYVITREEGHPLARGAGS